MIDEGGKQLTSFQDVYILIPIQFDQILLLLRPHSHLCQLTSSYHRPTFFPVKMFIRKVSFLGISM